MSFAIIYQTLFEIKIIHHYYLDNGIQLFDALNDNDKNEYLTNYSISDFIKISPTKTCEKILKNSRCIFKNTSTGMIVKIQVKKQGDNFIPYVDLADDIDLRFKIEFKDSLFGNYTSLPLNIGNNQIYYFQNRLIEEAREFPFLSQCPSIYDEDKYHSVGDMLVDDKVNPSKLFIAKAATVSEPPSNDWAEDTLVNGKILFYANKNDLFRVETDKLVFSFQQSDLNIPVSIRNINNVNFKPDYAVLKDKNLTVLTVNLKNLPEDIYYINIEPYQKEFPFFLLKDNDSDIKAIIDISIKSNNTSFNVLNDDKTIREQIFELRFKNRYTLWQFLGENFSNQPTSGPNPLTKYGLINISVQDSNGQNIEDFQTPQLT